MTISDEGLRLIKSFEGFVGHSYLDAACIRTIGYGHVILKGEERLKTARLTEAEASELLRKDVNTRFAPVVTRLLGGTKVNQQQMDALVSFAFNVGTGGLQRSSLLKLVKAGVTDPSVLHNAFGLWNKAGGRVLADLVARRRKEADHYLTA